jgi:hypothetical protein
MEIQDSPGAKAVGDVAEIQRLASHREHCVSLSLSGRAEADRDSCLRFDETLGEAGNFAEQHHMLERT